MQIRQALQTEDFSSEESPFSATRSIRPAIRPADLSGNGRVAAVLILLIQNENDCLDVLLTRRHPNLNHHGGQISFPGGQVERNESLAQAAMREVSEEVGIEGSSLEILGQLNPVYIPPSDFTVTPFVGWAKQMPNLSPCPHEVAEVLIVPLDFFFAPINLHLGFVTTSMNSRQVHYFDFNGHQIWGATAVMIDELTARIRRSCMR